MQSTTANYIPVQLSIAQYSPVEPRTAQYSPPQPSTVHYIPEQPSTAQYSPVQPNTDQYSPVQSNIAQCSPLQPTTTSWSERIHPCIYISSLSRQSFAQKRPGLVVIVFGHTLNWGNQTKDWKLSENLKKKKMCKIEDSCCVCFCSALLARQPYL